MVGLDRRVDRWVAAHRLGALDPVFVFLTRIGSYGAVWIVLAALLALLARRPRVLVLVAVAVYGSDLAAAGLKAAVDRRRPPLGDGVHALVGVPASGSFPSGHAATSFAGATMLAALRPRVAVPVYLLATAIAWSRVYVGVHYPLDVLGGAALGAAVATALLLLVRFRRRSGRSPRRG